MILFDNDAFSNKVDIGRPLRGINDTVYDELDGKYLHVRVGERPYEVGDEHNSDLKTDMQTTLFPLPEEEIIELGEDIKFQLSRKLMYIACDSLIRPMEVTVRLKDVR